MSDIDFWSWPPGAIDNAISELQQQYLPSLDRLDMAGLLKNEGLGKVAIVSSFGVESGCLLHFVSQLLPAAEVIFVDTLLHFPETLKYRDQLVEKLKLNLVTVAPHKKLLSTEDPRGDLYSLDPNGCCLIRKVFPLQDQLASYNSWISGRKRYQGGQRSNIPILERSGEHIKVNPLATWTKSMVINYMRVHEIPIHPLLEAGYRSVGCWPCTSIAVQSQEDRAGRWIGREKTECGIHLGPDGNFSRKRVGRSK